MLHFIYFTKAPACIKWAPIFFPPVLYTLVAVGGWGTGPTELMVEQCHFFVRAYGMYLCCGGEGSSNGFGVLYAFTEPQHKISSS